MFDADVGLISRVCKTLVVLGSFPVLCRAWIAHCTRQVCQLDSRLISCLGSRVSGFGSRVSGLGIMVLDLGSPVLGEKAEHATLLPRRDGPIVGAHSREHGGPL